MRANENDLVCRECGWIGKYSEILKAPNPFEDGELMACPQCKHVEDLRILCEAADCNQEATCGTPTDDGYIRCCIRHWRTL